MPVFDKVGDMNFRVNKVRLMYEEYLMAKLSRIVIKLCRIRSNHKRDVCFWRHLFSAHDDPDADATCVVLESPILPKFVRPIYENSSLFAASRQLIEFFNPLGLMIPSWQL